MKHFDLELRVKEFGSILTWEILLEDATNKGNSVMNWNQGDGFVFKKISDCSIEDNALDVFAGCRGIRGGTVTCEVFINGAKRSNDVVSHAEDKNFSTQSYDI
jgi:hypothetical protein